MEGPEISRQAKFDKKACLNVSILILMNRLGTTSCAACCELFATVQHVGKMDKTAQASIQVGATYSKNIIGLFFSMHAAVYIYILLGYRAVSKTNNCVTFVNIFMEFKVLGM